MKTTGTLETMTCLPRFLPPSEKTEIIHTDKWKQIIKACQHFTRNPDTSTRHRSETNGVAERTVFRVKEGTAIVQVQSGLPKEWWDCAMGCYFYLRNVHDKMADGKTAFEKRYGETFDGPFISCRTRVECMPISAKDKSRVHHLGKKTLKGIFLD